MHIVSGLHHQASLPYASSAHDLNEPLVLYEANEPVHLTLSACEWRQLPEWPKILVPSDLGGID